MHDGLLDDGGITVGDAPEVPLEDWIESLQTKFCSRAFVLPELLLQVFEDVQCVGPPAKHFMGLSMPCVVEFSPELINDLDIDERDLEFTLPLECCFLVGYLLGEWYQYVPQLFILPVQKILHLECVVIVVL